MPGLLIEDSDKPTLIYDESKALPWAGTCKEARENDTIPWTKCGFHLATCRTCSTKIWIRKSESKRVFICHTCDVVKGVQKALTSLVDNYPWLETGGMSAIEKMDKNEQDEAMYGVRAAWYDSVMRSKRQGDHWDSGVADLLKDMKLTGFGDESVERQGFLAEALDADGGRSRIRTDVRDVLTPPICNEPKDSFW